MKKYFFYLLLTALTLPAQAEVAGLHIILDNHLLQTSATENELLERMESFILETNDYYEESGVNLQLRLEKVDFRDVSDNGSINDPATILENISGQYGVFNNIFQEADRYGADFIVAILDDLGDFCGSAYKVNTSQREISSISQAFAVVRLDCGSDTFAHELGHVMGLAHGDKVADCTGISAHALALKRYAKGWAEGNCNQANDANEFGTIMVGNWLSEITGWDNISSYILPLFSSPKLSHPICGKSQVCGNARRGNSVKALNENLAKYAGHEERDADLLHYPDNHLSTCIADAYAFTEIADVLAVDCAAKGIHSIRGIAQLAQLSEINLANNAIVNISPLHELENIDHINLSGNNTVLCHQLRRLETRLGDKVTSPEKCLNIGAIISSESLI